MPTVKEAFSAWCQAVQQAPTGSINGAPAGTYIQDVRFVLKTDIPQHPVPPVFRRKIRYNLPH